MENNRSIIYTNFFPLFASNSLYLCSMASATSLQLAGLQTSPPRVWSHLFPQPLAPPICRRLVITDCHARVTQGLVQSDQGRRN